MITQLDWGGGAERQIFLLVTRLSRKRFSPTVLSLKHGGAWAGKIREKGVPVIELERHQRFEFARLRGLWRALRAIRPELVVTYLFTANTYGRLLSILAGVPHRISCERGGDLKTPIRLWVDRLLAPRTDMIVFNSKQNEEFMRAAGVRAEMRTIYNGIEVPSVDSPCGREVLESLGAPPDALWIGNVASLYPKKDHDLFLDMARHLAARPDLHFVIVGEGPERGSLERRAEEMGLRGRVTFTGHLRDPLPVISCFQVKVLTSLREGQSNALMEAMSLGVPCVASSAGGNEELITDGVDGFVVRQRDPRLFAERVAALLDSPRLREAMSQAARRRMREQFSVERMVRAYEDVFDDVLRRQGPKLSR